jgi:hypothetical protein
MDEKLSDIIDELAVVNSLIEAAYLAAGNSRLEHSSPLATLLDVTSQRLKQARAALDQCRAGLRKVDG